MAANRFHVNSLGVTAPCRARYSCPFGDLQEEHYNSKEEAATAYEKKMEEKLLTTHSRAVDSKDLGVHEEVKLLTSRLKDRLSTVKDFDRRVTLAALTNRLSEVRSTTELSKQLYLMGDSAEHLHSLGREDLEEVTLMALDVAKASHKKMLEEEVVARSATRTQHAFRRARAALAELDAATAAQNAERIKEMQIETAMAAHSLEVQQEELKKAQEVYALSKEAHDAVALHALNRPLTAKKRPLGEEDVAFDDSREYRFVTPDGDSHSVREVMAGAVEAYPGRASVAKEEAAKIVQSNGEKLTQLLSKEGIFTPPTKNEGIEDSSGEFTLLSAGGENNAYLHTPTQMVYKVPHSRSLMFGSVVGDRRKKRVMKTAVGLVESKYVELEERLDVEGEAAGDVEYLKTYFVSGHDEAGESVPMTVQPMMDKEVYTPIDLMEYDGEAYMKLNSMGFRDMHFGNVMADRRSGKIVLFDCLLIQPEARDAAYAPVLEEEDWEW